VLKNTLATVTLDFFSPVGTGKSDVVKHMHMHVQGLERKKMVIFSVWRDYGD
jgi:hypothetical protein